MAHEESGKEQGAAQIVHIEGRERLTISGVSDVAGFDENMVVLSTALGDLTVRGEGLHIEKIDLEAGRLELHGKLRELSYVGAHSRNIAEGVLDILYGRLNALAVHFVHYADRVLHAGLYGLNGIVVVECGKLVVEHVQLGFYLHHGAFIIGHQPGKFIGFLQGPFHHIRADQLLQLAEAAGIYRREILRFLFYISSMRLFSSAAGTAKRHQIRLQ